MRKKTDKLYEFFEKSKTIYSFKKIWKNLEGNAKISLWISIDNCGIGDIMET